MVYFAIIFNRPYKSICNILAQLLNGNVCSRTIAPLNACHCSNREQDCFSMT
ncbi:hypothetical protein T12_10759 [Trichinella patagoniensis]|uniref:Uncharacterized protein n=1 Tax=Trichinella patagoniensis TaxID=990121 RepID=A0A0V0YXJ9_9BILA|nr:hypothetical protein T12_10759 [Trichinella patagoniensis]